MEQLLLQALCASAQAGCQEAETELAVISAALAHRLVLAICYRTEADALPLLVQLLTAVLSESGGTLISSGPLAAEWNGVFSTLVAEVVDMEDSGALGTLLPLLERFTLAASKRRATTNGHFGGCLLYTSPSPRDRTRSRMPSSA